MHRLGVRDRIAVSREVAVRFGCNGVLVRRTTINRAACTAIYRDFESCHFEVRKIKVDEFLKAGGSAMSQMVRFDGENVAA